MLISSVPMTVFAEEKTIYLETAEDVLELAEQCISDAWSQGKTIVLNNDINLSGTAFKGIPTFGGTFLGQGHTISGYYLTQQQNAVGFFRYLQKNAVVEDLHLKGLIQPSKGDNFDIGGITGVNRGTIKNCSFEGVVSGTERVGGIVGNNKVSGIVENCTVTGTVYGDHYVGGICGENAGVIRKCVNHAEVNTQVTHNSISAGISSSLSIDSIKESNRDATNLGGIAGTSSGVIRDSVNHAAVGYEKMGYNVGGIAGSQIGYITNCENYGTINGSDGVGGIVGQFKPNVVLNMGENYMSTLMDQMINMMSSMSGMMNSMDSMMGGMSFNKEDMEDSMDMLKDPENLDPDAMQAAMNEMSNSFNDMYQDMMKSGSEMTNQMNGMMGSMSEMVGTMEKLNEGLNIKIIDISKEDTSKDTIAKVNQCANHGAVYGETYVGGVAGIADIEDTSANEDAEGQLSFSTEGEMIMRLVVRDCKNTAKITASKQYAGGIVGEMVIGAIFDGKNIGNVEAVNADYVGGIVGSSETYLKGCVSRSILSGSKYVGGIAGFGTEVLDSYAITEISAATKFAGGILGYAKQLPDEEAGMIQGNRYYVTENSWGGIDGIAYQSAATPISVEKFLELKKLDDMFKTVAVRFTADGQEDVVMTVKLGETLAIEEVPVLDVEKQEQYQWEPYVSQESLTNILFDQTYQAEFDTKNTVIASEEKLESGPSKALAVGVFDCTTTLNITDITGQELIASNMKILEISEIAISGSGVERLHYFIPEGAETENMILHVKNASGKWEQRDFSVEGSYIIFDFVDGEGAIALEETAGAMNLTIMFATAAAAIVGIGILFKLIKAKKKGNMSEEQ